MAVSTRTPSLHQLARSGDADGLRDLLLGGADPDLADDYGRTALYFAARDGHEPVVAVLLAHGAAIDPAIDYDPDLSETLELDGETRARAALEMEDLASELAGGTDELSAAIAQALRGMEIPSSQLKRAARVHTPLCAAVACGHSGITRRLIRNGANCDHSAGGDGTTPLHLAVQKRQHAVLRELLAGGARPVEDQFGVTPLALAVELGDATSREILTGAEAPDDEAMRLLELNLALERGQLERANRFLEEGVAVDRVDMSDRCPLQIATYYEHWELVPRLLDAGARVDKRAVRRAVQHGDSEIVSAMLRCDPELPVGLQKKLRRVARERGWAAVEREVARLYPDESP